MMESDPEELMEKRIKNMVDEVLNNNAAILGIVIGSSSATSIYSEFKDEKLRELSENRLVASSTSIQFISNSLYQLCQGFGNKSEWTYSIIDQYVLCIMIVKQTSGLLILKKDAYERGEIAHFKPILEDLLLRIDTLIETTDSSQEDLFVLIKRSIPSANLIGLISNEGLPIRVEADNAQIEPAMIASHISGITHSIPLIMGAGMDHTIIQGVQGTIIIDRISPEKLLIIGMSEKKEQINFPETQINEILNRVRKTI